MGIEKERAEEIRQKSLGILLKNRRKEGGLHYTIPSGDSYPYQWLWDSCFHAIALSHLDAEFGKEEIRTLLMRQFGNGMIPHIIYWKPGPLHWYDWGLVGTSTLTQPPMVAYAIWQLYEKTGDTDFVRETFPLLMHYYRYLLERRDPFKRNLVGIINPDESGEDNSPRFDTLLNAPYDISGADHLKRRLALVEVNRACGFDEACMDEHFWVEDVSFNSIVLRNLEALGEMAALLGRKEDIQYCKEHGDRIRGAMRAFMFEDGVFWSLATRGNFKLKTATWIHFMPLFAGLYSREEAEHVVREHLRNEQTFRAPFGVRTVSRKEPSYNGIGYSEEQAKKYGGFWRGPVWFAAQWFVYRGLIRYGFKEDADWVCETSFNLIETAGFREHFNPETGAGGGARDFTWGSLAVDMLDEK